MKIFFLLLSFLFNDFFLFLLQNQDYSEGDEDEAVTDDIDTEVNLVDNLNELSNIEVQNLNLHNIGDIRSHWGIDTIYRGHIFTSTYDKNKKS